MKIIIPFVALLLVGCPIHAQDCRTIKRTLEPSTGNNRWAAPIVEHLYLVKSYKPELKGTY